MATVHIVPGDRVALFWNAGETVQVGPFEVNIGTGGLPLITAFRLPIKQVDKAWYEATRRYGPYNVHPHKCEDWNLEEGGNSDLGEPLVAPFSALVLAARDYGGGIGQVVQLVGLTAEGEIIVWAGWHLHSMAVSVGQIVHLGADIGTIGNAGGRYAGAHLHEQIAIVRGQGIPGPTTFASDARYDWQQPSVFYVARGVDADLVRRMTEWDGK